MTNRPKNIGTAAETAVVRAARLHGFPHADRLTLTGALDRGDVGLCPGVIIEVKGGEQAKTASDALIDAWLIDTERERRNAHADIGILVTTRRAIGAPNAHRWWAHMTCGTLIDLIWGTRDADTAQPATITTTAPIRMTLANALQLLRANGYGEPLEVEARDVPATVYAQGVPA